uniref:Uncharacterized protein n=1 Tax=Meloidogyne hapla TaxID=6305 RepID=A0A1I8B5K4_MELHA
MNQTNQINKLEEINIPLEGCFVEFPLEKDIFGWAYLFRQGTTVMKENLEKLKSGEEKIKYFFKKEDEEKTPKNEEKYAEIEEGEGNARLGTFALLEAIYKGRNGFGEGEQIYLDWSNIPKIEIALEKKRLKGIKNTAKRIFDKTCKHLWKIIKNVERKIWLKDLWFVKLFDRKLSKNKDLPLIDEKNKELKELEQTLDENLEKLNSSEMLGKTTIEQKISIEISEKSKHIEDNLLEELNKLSDIKLKKKRIEEFKDYIRNFEDDGQKRFDKEIKVEIDENIHKKLLEIKVHPFNFLQNISYNVKIKPLGKHFEKIGSIEYEEIVEYFKNPNNFIKNDKITLNENSLNFLYKEFKKMKEILEKRKKSETKDKVYF